MSLLRPAMQCWAEVPGRMCNTMAEFVTKLNHVLITSKIGSWPVLFNNLVLDQTRGVVSCCCIVTTYFCVLMNVYLNGSDHAKFPEIRNYSSFSESRPLALGRHLQSFIVQQGLHVYLIGLPAWTLIMVEEIALFSSWHFLCCCNFGGVSSHACWQDSMCSTCVCRRLSQSCWYWLAIAVSAAILDKISVLKWNSDDAMDDQYMC